MVNKCINGILEVKVFQIVQRLVIKGKLSQQDEIKDVIEPKKEEKEKQPIKF